MDTNITNVMPAQAGIQPHRQLRDLPLDSRFRGNDDKTFVVKFDFQQYV
jgi:hypothetical protein